MKKSRATIAPYTPPPRLTSSDLFGEDSDAEPPKTSNAATKTGIPPLHSYFTRRQAKGYTRQMSETKEGRFYIELKIYNAEEVQKIMPINRWRYAITTIKIKLDEKNESWCSIKDFVKLTKKDFKNCPISVVGSYECIG